MDPATGSPVVAYDAGRSAAALRIQAMMRGRIARKSQRVAEVRQALDAKKQSDRTFDSPFVATPQPVVEAMLIAVGVQQGDVVLDIGSGDGRVPRSAARLHGATGIGVEHDEKLVAKAKALLAAELKHTEMEEEKGERGKDVQLHCMDLRAEDLPALVAQATVIFLYMLPEANEFLAQLVGTHARMDVVVVSWMFQFDKGASEGEWALWKRKDITTTLASPDAQPLTLYMYKRA
jgi:SAM-dependent methyltransferase